MRRSELTAGSISMVVFAVALTSAGTARANVGGCTISGSTVICMPPTPCTDDAQCFATNGDRCALDLNGNGACSRDCSALFTCAVDTDCPVFGALVATCHASAIATLSGLCEYHDGTTLRVFVTYCATGPVTLANVVACLGPGQRWDTGDCDRDGLPNGTDAMPCTPDPSGTSLPPVRSPFCLHDRVCEGLSNVCAPLLGCASNDECAAVATHLSTPAAWECSALPGTGTETFCHPSCSATAHCGSSEPCDPRFGSCTGAATGIAMCLPMALAACRNGCLTNPLDWASAQGDCDHDGAQNGCDARPCTPGDPPCLFNHSCSIDAGADAGGNVSSDAGSDAALVSIDAFAGDDAAASDDAGAPDDAGRDLDATTIDATTRFDAAGSTVDANTPTPTPGLGFGGGGGCRCALVGMRDDGGLIAIVAVLLTGLARRRRPR